MRIKLSKQNWRLVGQKMGWLKKKASYETFEREYDDIKITYKGINFICSFKISGELDEGAFPHEPNFSDEDYVLAPMTKDNDPFGYQYHTKEEALTDPNASAQAEAADQRAEKWEKDNPDYVQKIRHLIWEKMGSDIQDEVEGDYRADWTDKDYRRQHDNFYGGER